MVLGGLAATLIILGAVVVVLWGSLIKGEFVSVFPDPWSYSSFASYLRDPLLPAGNGSQLIATFASALMGTRYATAGLLALLSGITGTDTCRSASLFAVMVLAQTGFGTVLLSRALGARTIVSFLAGVFAVTLGWIPEILKIGNWDQFLFLSLSSFVLFRIRLLTFPTSRNSGVFGLGLCMAAALFAYPEGTAISGVIYLPMVVWRLMRGKALLGKTRKLALASGVTILFSIVYLPTFVSFLRHQIAAGSTVLLAKGALGGLLSANWLPAIYCLGAQLPSKALYPLAKLELAVVVLFLGLTLVALKIWWKRRDGILLTFPFFLAVALWQAFLVRYDYGLYKVLTMYWPVMVAAIFVGISRISGAFGLLARPVAVLAFGGLMIAAVTVEVQNFRYAPWRKERKIQPFVELRKLKEISRDTPIRVQTESWFNQMWAVFFLQGYNIEVPNPLLYLKASANEPEKGTTNLNKAVFVLVDKKEPRAIWHNKIFYLLNRSNPVELLGVDAPNSVETVEGEDFLWLDNQFAVLTISSDADRRAFLVIPECWPGNSRPEDKKRTLILETRDETLEIPAEGNLKIPLTLRQGNNFVRLACKEHATTDKLPSGDTRTLLLGLKGFGVRAAD